MMEDTVLEALLWNNVKKQYKAKWQDVLRSIPKQGITREQLIATAPNDNYFKQVLSLLLKHDIVYNKNGFIVINDAYRHVTNKCINGA